MRDDPSRFAGGYQTSRRNVSSRRRFPPISIKPTPAVHKRERTNRFSARTDKAILDATQELLEEVGVRGLTVDGVAARSGVGKASIYRRYRGKEELALAVLLDWLDQVHPPSDLGDTRKELARFAETAVELLGSTLTRSVLRGLVSELASNAELAEVYRERIVEPRIADVKTIIARGISRGDLRPDTSERLVHELLIGPIYYRLLFSGTPLDDKLGGHVADVVTRTFAPTTDGP
jgi:AcrR family transcriptional regulator